MPFKMKYYKNNHFELPNYKDELYHYTKFNALESIISSKTIRFRKNNYSNDEFDGKISQLISLAFDLFEHENIDIKEACKWKTYKAFFGDFFRRDELQSLNKALPFHLLTAPSMFNFCLSSSNKSEKLWKEYANDEICIEFSEDIFRRVLDYPTGLNQIKYYGQTSSNVIYSDDLKINILKDIILNGYEDFIKNYESNNHSSYQSVFVDISTDLLLCSYFFKDEHKWSYENEYRFILIYQPQINTGFCLDDTEERRPYIEISFKGCEDIWNDLIKKIWVIDESYKSKVESLGIKCEILRDSLF